jgi:hypothetical protein
MRSRALLFFLALVGGLVAGSAATAAAVVPPDPPAREAPAAATRADVADVPAAAVALVRDAFATNRDGRRADLATLTTALTLAAAATWFRVRTRPRTRRAVRHELRRPRGPPDLPVLVSI